MTTRNEELQGLWHKYVNEHGGSPETPLAVVTWAMRRGLLVAPAIDPVVMLAHDMARALREEYRTDARGRRYRVNHAVRITRDGIQMSLWAEMFNAPIEHLVKAFAQRRKQIVGDCFQLKVDVDVCKEHRVDAEEIQVPLDFTDDVAELQALADDGKAA